MFFGGFSPSLSSTLKLKDSQFVILTPHELKLTVKLAFFLFFFLLLLVRFCVTCFYIANKVKEKKHEESVAEQFGAII